MTLSIKTDSSRAGGGYALLEGSGLADVTAISVESCASGQFLGEDGRWKKAPFAFPVETTPSGALSLGPHIVDFVPTELLVALRTQDGKELGRLFWTDVFPSRNPGSVTSTQVYEERRRQAEANAAEEAARLKDEAARRAADEVSAKRSAEAAEAEVKRAKEKAEAEDAARAAKQREEDNARKRAEAERDKDKPVPGRGRWAVVALLVLVLGAAAAFAFIPGLRDLFKPGQKKEVVERPTSPPERTQATPPAEQKMAKKTPPPNPPSAPPVDCTRAFGTRLDGLQRLTDDEKLTLGKDAIRDGCGLAAFRAFDVSAWESDEEAAWNLARFYDPNETRPVYRDVGQGHHADWAAVYYHHWRGRSERQAAALRAICEAANSGGASLQRSCAP